MLDQSEEEESSDPLAWRWKVYSDFAFFHPDYTVGTGI